MQLLKPFVIAAFVGLVTANLAQADTAAVTPPSPLEEQAAANAATLPESEAAKLKPALENFKKAHEMAELFGSASHGFQAPPCIPAAEFEAAHAETRDVAALTALLFDRASPALEGWMEEPDLALLAAQSAEIAVATLSVEIAKPIDAAHCFSRPALLAAMLKVGLKKATGRDDTHLVSALQHGSAFLEEPETAE